MNLKVNNKTKMNKFYKKISKMILLMKIIKQYYLNYYS